MKKKTDDDLSDLVIVSATYEVVDGITIPVTQIYRFEVTSEQFTSILRHVKETSVDGGPMYTKDMQI